MRKLLILLLCMFTATTVYAGTVTRYKTYATGDSLNADNLNGNFDNVVNEINSNLDNDNANVSGGFRFIEVLSALPAAGNQGRVVFTTGDNTLYFDTGATMIAVGVLANTQTWTGVNTFSSLIADTADINAGTVNGLTSLGIGATNISEFSTDGTMGGNSDVAVPTEQAVKTYTDSVAGVGNIVYTWTGVDNCNGVEYGIMQDQNTSGDTDDDYTADCEYLYVEVTGYRTLQEFYFKKLTGADTLRVYARLWDKTGDGSKDVTLQVEIENGGTDPECSIDSSSDSSPVWQTACTIDISALTDGSDYLGRINMKSETDDEPGYCSAVVVMGE